MISAGTYENNRRRVLQTRSVYDELVHRERDSQRPAHTVEQETTLKSVLAVLLTQNAFDADTELTVEQREATTLTNLALDQKLQPYLKFSRVKSSVVRLPTSPVHPIE